MLLSWKRGWIQVVKLKLLKSLPLNRLLTSAMNNIQIQQILSRIPTRAVGVFAADQIPLVWWKPTGTSDTCGYFCLMFLHCISVDFGIGHFLENFSSDLRKNDQIVRNYVSKLYSAHTAWNITVILL